MYTTKGKNKKLDRWTMIIGLCVPIVTLPQLYSVLTASNLQGVSLATWSLYAVQAAVFYAFGVKHKEKPLVFTYVPLFIVQFCIVATLVIRKF
jgi:uncharacterized protein with PQ loop repeat